MNKESDWMNVNTIMVYQVCLGSPPSGQLSWGNAEVRCYQYCHPHRFDGHQCWSVNSCHGYIGYSLQLLPSSNWHRYLRTTCNYTNTTNVFQALTNGFPRSFLPFLIFPFMKRLSGNSTDHVYCSLEIHPVLLGPCGVCHRLLFTWDSPGRLWTMRCLSSFIRLATY